MTVEAPIIFRGKVLRPCINEYLHLHSTHDTIIPALLVHNFPNDANIDVARNNDAIFNVETLELDKIGVFYLKNT